MYRGVGSKDTWIRGSITAQLDNARTRNKFSQKEKMISNLISLFIKNFIDGG